MNSPLQEIFGADPAVPQDDAELKYVLHLLNKIPHYKEKVDELAAHVREFAKLADRSRSLNAIKWGWYEIEKMIFRAFFVELENKPFKNITNETLLSLKTSLIHEGVINSRNKSCEICGENRSTDRCHILPARLGGGAEVNNCLILCPTHHRLFDRFMLSRNEYAAIDWDLKSEPSRIYADEVVLVAHRKFCRIAPYDIDSNAMPVIKHALFQFFDLYKDKKFLKRSSIYKATDPNLLPMLKKIITYLIKIKILARSENKTGYIVLIKLPRLDDKLIRTIWKIL